MLKSQRVHRGSGKDGKWDEKMEFLNEEDGIEGEIWRGEKGRGGTKSAAREREERDKEKAYFSAWSTARWTISYADMFS